MIFQNVSKIIARVKVCHFVHQIIFLIFFLIDGYKCNTMSPVNKQ